MLTQAYLIHRGNAYMTTLYPIWLWYIKYIKTNTGTAKKWSLCNTQIFFSRNPDYLHCCLALCCWQGLLNLFC